MEIRHSTQADFDRIMSIYAHARKFMAENGNPNQWGPTNWPPEELIRRDIEVNKSYVCVHEGKTVGTFYFDFGDDIEPSYRVIENGAWRDAAPYGVVHRLAGDGSVHGIGKFCLDWAFDKCRHIRIDTHEDNAVMHSLLKKCGFEFCGIIHVKQDNYPRVAYEKTLVK